MRGHERLLCFIFLVVTGAQPADTFTSSSSSLWEDINLAPAPSAGPPLSIPEALARAFGGHRIARVTCDLHDPGCALHAVRPNPGVPGGLATALLRLCSFCSFVFVNARGITFC